MVGDIAAPVETRDPKRRKHSSIEDEDEKEDGM